MVLKRERGATSQGPAKPEAPRARVLIIEARFYEKISDLLAAGAAAELDAAGASYERVLVPGALEIPQALAQAVAAKVIPAPAERAQFDGCVALGCVIRGETTHYEIVSNNANFWLMELAMAHCIPVGNGILTVENEAQALARARGPEGKGGDAVRACLHLIELAHALKGQTA